MLELRPNCESCDEDLAPNGADALICSFECTFCLGCAEAKFDFVCPNCGGNLVIRPMRPEALLTRYPASAERVNKDHH